MRNVEGQPAERYAALLRRLSDDFEMQAARVGEHLEMMGAV